MLTIWLSKKEGLLMALKIFSKMMQKVEVISEPNTGYLTQ